MFRKILVALDLNDPGSARRVLETAVSCARQNDAELHALTVVPAFAMPIVGSYFAEGYEEKGLEAAQRALGEFLRDEAGGYKVQGHVAHGAIYDEVLRVADKLGCDLIVLGAHRPELKDYLLGPNAARVVRHARQSVIVVRQDEG